MGRPDLDAIKARLKAATPGPWYRRTVPDGDSDDGPNGSDFVTLDIDCDGEEVARTGWGPDADLIAHAPTDLADVLAYVREVEAERDEAAAQLAAARAAYATRYDDGEGRPVAELVMALIGEIDAIRESRERVRAEADRLEQELDRLAQVLRCERGEWAPEGWTWDPLTRAWRCGLDAVWQESNTSEWHWGVKIRGDIVLGKARTALDAIEAADAAIREVRGE